MRYCILLAFGLVFVFAEGRFVTRATSNQDHEQWLEERYVEATSIKPGMTRADLLKSFEEDGGLQSIPASRYVLRSCKLIQIEVKFNTEYGLSYQPTPDKDLKISSVSRPYLERMAVD